MKLKTFRAPSMPLALAQVKRQIGSDAVIVRTRTFKRGGFLKLGSRTMVEITARPNHEDSAPRPHYTARTDRLRRSYNLVPSPSRANSTQRRVRPITNTVAARGCPPGARLPLDIPALSEELKSEIGNIRTLVEGLVKEQRQLHAPQMPEQLFELYLDLIQREVADELAREMISRIQQDMTGNQLASAELIRQKLVDVMDRMIATAGPICRNLDGGARVVALIGPTGVGKTTTIAKLAANFTLREHKKVGLITIDTYRIGAVDQLRMYAQIVNVPLKVVLTPAELTEAIAQMSNMDVLLIDTAGRSQNDELKIKELQTFLEAAQPHEVHLVLAGTGHRAHMLSAAEKFNRLGVDRIILTKLDEAVSFGVALSVMQKVDAAFSYITTGQDVPSDIEVCNGRRLAQMLLNINEPSGLAEIAGYSSIP